MSKIKGSRSYYSILYADNNKHVQAIERAKLLPCVIMFHDHDINDDGEPLKAHWHLAFRYHQQYYISKLLKDLGLNEDDNHLFLALKEIKAKYNNKYKTFDDYLIYMTHQNEDDKYFYDPNLFQGIYRDYAIEICKEKDINKEKQFNEILQFLNDSYKDSSIIFRITTEADLYFLLCDKFGTKTIFNQFSRLRPFIKDFKDW